MDSSSQHAGAEGASSGDGRSSAVSVRPATESDRSWLEQTLADRWGTLTVARLDELVDLTPLPALVAEHEGDRVGVLTYQIEADAWEVVTIDATVPGIGAGAALLKAVTHRARTAAARRVWLITTNDNTHGLRFYQRNGFDLVAMHRNAMDRARRLKPSIPVTGNDGILIRHELELELCL